MPSARQTWPLSKLKLKLLRNTLINLGRLGRLVEDIHEKLQAENAKVDRKQYLKWLDHVDMDTKLEKLLYLRAEGTCDWIFAEEHVRGWLSSGPESKRMLWLTADPGFGKSTISAYIAQQTQRRYPTGVAYFFCSHDESTTLRVDASLRSWIW